MPVIDLHAHILCGIDDGPELIDGSIALARAAREAGTHLMAATPHLRSDHPAVRVEQLRDRCDALEQALADAAIDIRILPGAEVDLLWAHAASPEQLRLATYGQRGTDMLLETPYGPVPHNFGGLVEWISDHGIRVLLAHPERNPTFQRDPGLVLDLVARGILVQVTAMSLVPNGRSSRALRLAHWLVEREAVHVIASDAHTQGPWRPPDLQSAHDVVRAITPARLEWMVHEVPAAIVAGEPLPTAPNGGAPRRLGKRQVRAVRRVLNTRLT